MIIPFLNICFMFFLKRFCISYVCCTQVRYKPKVPAPFLSMKNHFVKASLCMLFYLFTDIMCWVLKQCENDFVLLSKLYTVIKMCTGKTVKNKTTHHRFTSDSRQHVDIRKKLVGHLQQRVFRPLHEPVDSHVVY